MYATPEEPRIETARLMLRPPRTDDAVYLAELANDPDVARMTTGVTYPYRLADAERFLAALRSRGSERNAVFLVEHRDVGPMGLAGLYRKQEHWPELGFWLGHSFRGRGFATEAVKAVLGWAVEGWRSGAILAGHFRDNAASARVLDKAGFLYTGEVRRRFSHGRQREVDTRMMVWLP